jgi:hypothetical protein
MPPLKCWYANNWKMTTSACPIAYCEKEGSGLSKSLAQTRVLLNYPSSTLYTVWYAHLIARQYGSSLHPNRRRSGNYFTTITITRMLQSGTTGSMESMLVRSISPPQWIKVSQLLTFPRRPLFRVCQGVYHVSCRHLFGGLLLDQRHVRRRSIDA